MIEILYQIIDIFFTLFETFLKLIQVIVKSNVMQSKGEENKKRIKNFRR